MVMRNNVDKDISSKGLTISKNIENIRKLVIHTQKEKIDKYCHCQLFKHQIHYSMACHMLSRGRTGGLGMG